jgi:hypothetical protein
MKKIFILTLVVGFLLSGIALADTTYEYYVSGRVKYVEKNPETDTGSDYYNLHVRYWYTDDTQDLQGDKVYGDLDYIEVVE